MSETPPKPDAGATVLMSSTVLKPPAPKPAPAAPASNRLRYEVRPVGDEWEVVAAGHRIGPLHANAHDATLAARADARQQWFGDGRPTRVVLLAPEGEQMVALYGHEPPPAPGAT